MHFNMTIWYMSYDLCVVCIPTPEHILKKCLMKYSIPQNNYNNTVKIQPLIKKSKFQLILMLTILIFIYE